MKSPPPDILGFFPSGKTPRPAQAELLLQVQANWTSADVIVLLCPPAAGKTELAYTISHWRAACGNTATYLVPDNVLVRQTAARYPFIHLLRRDLYKCECTNHTAEDVQKACSTAKYRRAKQVATDAKVRLMNSHVYRANRLYSSTVIFDEAHKVRDSLEGEAPLRIWHHDYKFPTGLATIADVIAWGQGHLSANPDDERLRDILIQIGRVRDTSTIEDCKRAYRGTPTRVLEVRSCTARLAAKRLWPEGRVSKIILMSATIGHKDVAELGLDRRRVLYLQCESPIPAEQRPVVFKRVCNMAAKYMDHALPLLAKELRGLLDGTEPGKGLIHLPYNLAERLRPILQHPRLMWHTKRNKQEALAAFAASPAEHGRVLVCSGLYEGVDLPFDDDSWQVIGKVPFLSLGDEEVRRRLSEDPDWYDWQAIKLLLQAYGRLPRRPDGRGTTYIFDTNYERLLRTDKSRKTPMFPIHYLAATQRGIAS